MYEIVCMCVCVFGRANLNVNLNQSLPEGEVFGTVNLFLLLW